MRAFLFCLFLVVFAYYLVMKIWNELTSFIKDPQSLFAQRSFSVYGKNLVVIQGFKKVVSVTGGEVAFDFNDGFLKIVGQDLVVKKIMQGFAIIQGHIEQVVF